MVAKGNELEAMEVIVQALSCEDCDIRIEFAESLLAWIQEELNLLQHVL